MKIGSVDLAKHIKEIKVRAHVVLRLGYDLIAAGHTAYVKVRCSFLQCKGNATVFEIFCY